MIVLDTHIWVWHASGSDRLTREQHQRLRAQESEGLGVSVISCWEVAKLVEYDRLELTMSVGEWVEQALRLPVAARADAGDRRGLDTVARHFPQRSC